MRRIVLPKDLECIDEYAFSSCYDVKCLIVHSGLRRVGADAFRNCFDLQGLVIVGRPPVLEEGSLVEDGRHYTVFAVGYDREMLDGKYRENWMRDCAIEPSISVDAAVSACDVPKRSGRAVGMYNGLETALRLAAEGLVADLPISRAGVGGLDLFVAELHKLMQMERSCDIKRFISGHCRFCSDAGPKMTGIFDALNDISITVEFDGGRLLNIALSKGMKNAIHKGIAAGSEELDGDELDESVLRWMK